jgi:putative ABC transport system permease protein
MASHPPRFVSALYRVTLHVQPRAVRERFGAEQAELFAALWRDERPAGMPAAAIWTAGQVWRAVRAGVGARVDRLWRRWPAPAPRPPRFAGTGLATDARYALRSLLRARWFTAGAVLTFALGMGANIAVFSVVDRMLFRPLPYGDADRLVQIDDVHSTDPTDGVRLLQAVLVTLRDRATSFEGIAYANGSQTQPVPGSSASPLALATVSYNMLSVLHVHPILGRDFTREDARADPATRRTLVILTYAAWQHRLGGVSDVLTQSFAGYHILGVLPRGFLIPSSQLRERTDGLTVDADLETMPAVPGWIFMAPVARLRSGVTLAQAQAEADALAAGLRQQMPLVARFEAGRAGPRILPLQAGLFVRVRPYLWLIVAAVAMVLLVACANLSTLLAARGRSREREIAVRSALGATRRRLIAANLLESLVLCVASGVVALVVALATRTALVGLLPSGLRSVGESPLDPRVVVFTFGAALASAGLAALGPARRATQVNLLDVLQRGTGGSMARLGAGRVLLGLQAALCSALVLGAALTVHSFLGLLLRPAGFSPQNLYSVLAEHGHPTGPSALRHYDVARVRGILEIVRQTPGVQAAGAVTFLPVGSAVGDDPFWKSRNLHGGEWGVGAGFFAALETPLRAGREFTELEIDTRALVAIVSESGAKQLWPDQPPVNAVGRTIATDDGPRTVVGVVADLRPRPGIGPVPALYVPVTAEEAPYHQSALTVAVRTAPGISLDVASLRQRLDARFGRAPLSVSGVDAQITPWLQAPRFQAMLFGSVAVIGLVLAAAGLYALASFEAARRRYEMGVRLTLGASVRDLRRLVIAGAVRPVAVGTVAGLAAGWWGATLLRAFVFDIDVHDPWTFGLVALVLLATAVVAAWLPARRAGRIDPAAILRTT